LKDGYLQLACRVLVLEADQPHVIVLRRGFSDKLLLINKVKSLKMPQGHLGDLVSDEAFAMTSAYNASEVIGR
jgi:hypothetical protein